MRAGQHRAKEGRDRPRWRAKLRHRLDRTPAAAPVPDPDTSLQAWLQDRGWEELPVDQLEKLELTAYLRATASIPLAPTERLRQLAIALESSLLRGTQPRGWLALERIYAFGRSIDPGDPVLETSRAITAEQAARDADDQPDVRRRMLLVGKDAAGRAIDLKPDHAAAHYVLGMLDYSRNGSLESALACFERAIRHDPALGWAQLYRAHCLHDLERWAEAAQAYADVDPSYFTGRSAWRYDLLREQRAFCLLQAGDEERALAEFLAILHRYEREPRLARWQLLRELTAAAKGSLHAELSDRFAQLLLAIERLDAPAETDEASDDMD
ncbi:Hypothetical protein A7982_00872 [Minicystis rosea]|nr:Hypothetical protein A7982_00872 [Minicystis rosea]